MMYRILIVVFIASPARITGSTEPGSAHGLDHRIGSLERIMDQIIGSDHGSDLSQKNVIIKIIIT